MSDAEKAAICAVAAELNLSVSETTRRAVAALCGSGPTLDGPEREAVADLTKELNAVGRNLNQIAKALNSGRFRDDPDKDALVASLEAEMSVITDLVALYKELCADRRARMRRAVG